MKVSDERLKKASEYFNTKLNFEDYLKDKGLLSHSTTTYSGVIIVCPFHDDNSPSLRVDTSRNIYKCFACSAKGNLISFMTNHDKVAFGGSGDYSLTLDRLLKKDSEAQRALGFSSIYEDSVDLNALRKNGIRKLKIAKSKPKTFLELSHYIRTNGTEKDKIDAIKLMQNGYEVSVIYDILYGKRDSLPNESQVFNFTGMTLEDLLRED